MSPGTVKLALVGALALLLITAVSIWQVQDWRYGGQLAQQALLHQSNLSTLSNAAAAKIRTDQDKRLALEQRLSASDQSHHEALTNAQKNQARLRDLLATADLRLSVLLDVWQIREGRSTSCRGSPKAAAGSDGQLPNHSVDIRHQPNRRSGRPLLGSNHDEPSQPKAHRSLFR
ncbi:lysis protein [Pseudomonas laurylsulfatiphila]|uniref:lysis protein n=1 Tax=Pseudomonas laurylsulfatiphila TaxID=2011015 RepID=UPI003D1A1D69